MKKRFDLKSFVCGVLVAATVLTLTTPVMAAYTSKTINGLTGIKVYIDDQLFTPRDPNGKVVEPFVADGTTYLPMRAIAEAVGLPVQWDGKTQSAYVGKHSKGSVSLDKLTVIDASGNYKYDNTAFTDTYGETYYGAHLFGYNYSGESFAIFNLKGEYTTFSGSIVPAPGLYGAANVDYNIYADDELIYSKTGLDKTTERIDFSINVSGGKKLTIRVKTYPKPGAILGGYLGLGCITNAKVE